MLKLCVKLLLRKYTKKISVRNRFRFGSGSAREVRGSGFPGSGSEREVRGSGFPGSGSEREVRGSGFPGSVRFGLHATAELYLI